MTSAPGSVELLVLRGPAVAALRPAVCALWGEVFAQPPYAVTREQVAGFPDVLARQAQRPGFACVAAVRSGDARLMGFAYGAITSPEPLADPWYQRVCGAVGEAADGGVRGAFELAELAVRPETRRQGLGRRLVGALLDGAEARRAWLVTLAEAPSSRAFYASLGWSELGAVTFSGRPDRFVILGWERRG